MAPSHPRGPLHLILPQDGERACDWSHEQTCTLFPHTLALVLLRTGNPRAGRGRQPTDLWSQSLLFLALLPTSPLLPGPLFPGAAIPPPRGGNWSVSWKTPGAGLGASVPCIRVQGRREPGGQTGLRTHQWGRSRLASKSPPPPHPHCCPWRPRRDGGGRRAGLEDRTSSWQDTGRQAGGSQPQSRPRGEKVTGAWVSPVPRWASALMASPSCFISEDSRPSSNETPLSLIPPPRVLWARQDVDLPPPPSLVAPGPGPLLREPHRAQERGAGLGGAVTCTVGSPPQGRNRLLQMNLGPTALEARFHTGPALPSQDKKLIDS